MRLGSPEIAIVGFVLAVVIAAVWWQIFSKAGHGGWMGLLMLIPVVNLIMLLFLAFSDWPVRKELRRLRDAKAAQT